MKRIVYRILLMALFVLGQGPSYGKAAQDLKLYFIDVGWGNATLIISPSDQAMLTDTGEDKTAGRVLDILKLAGVKRIDYVVLTHYHSDHNGGLKKAGCEYPHSNDRGSRAKHRICQERRLVEATEGLFPAGYGQAD